MRHLRWMQSAALALTLTLGISSLAPTLAASGRLGMHNEFKISVNDPDLIYMLEIFKTVYPQHL